LVEQLIRNQQVTGSSPVSGSFQAKSEKLKAKTGEEEESLK
jgi:hypothetical protein